MDGGAALAGHRAALRRRGRGAPARLGPRGAHARPARRRAAVATLLAERSRRRARRAHRRPGRAEGARPGSRRSTCRGWQVAADANLAGQTYPDQCLYPANSVPAVVRRINNALLRADQIALGRGRRSDTGLAGADRRRRRGRLRRPAQRLRADEGDDRGRRRRRALGGPARLREEVRPPRRQGARPDEPAHPHAQRGPARGRRRRRADDHRRPHRRARRDAARPATSTSATAVPHRRAHRRGLLPGAQRHRAGRSPAASPTRRTPTCSGSRPRRPTSTRRASSPRRSTRGTPASCWPTTARRRSTGSAHLDDAEIARFQRRARRAGLPLPVHHPRRLPRPQPLDVRARARLRARGHERLRRAPGARVRLEAAGYTATRHQREVGTGYFDHVATGPDRRRASTLALVGSTEEEQFDWPVRAADRRARRTARGPRSADDDDPHRRAPTRASLEPALGSAQFGPRRECSCSTGAHGSRPASALARGRAAGLPARDARSPRRPVLARRAAAGPTCATGASRSPARPTAR